MASPTPSPLPPFMMATLPSPAPMRQPSVVRIEGATTPPPGAPVQPMVTYMRPPVTVASPAPTLRPSFSSPVLPPAGPLSPVVRPLRQPMLMASPSVKVLPPSVSPPPVVRQQHAVTVKQTGHEAIFRGYGESRRDLEACKAMIRNLNYEMAILKTSSQDLSLKLASQEAEIHMRRVATGASPEVTSATRDVVSVRPTLASAEPIMEELDQALSEYVQANSQLGVQIVKTGPGRYEVNEHAVEMINSPTKGPCVIVGESEIPLTEFVMLLNESTAVIKPKPKGKPKAKAKGKAKAGAKPKAKAKAKAKAGAKPKASAKKAAGAKPKAKKATTRK